MTKREKQNAAVRKWRAKNPEKNREFTRINNWKNQGIDMDIQRYNELAKKQNNRCAICKNPPNGRWGLLDVDHDHETGKVRGLLCNSCNRALGLLKDSLLVVESAVRYLKEADVDV